MTLDSGGNGNKGRETRVLILDYFVNSSILSGHSLLTLVEIMDTRGFQLCVVFNRGCDLERELSKRGFHTKVIRYGGGPILRRIWEYSRLPFALWLLSMEIRPHLLHANNVMAGRPAVVLSKLTGIPVIIHLRNIGMPKRSSWLVRRADRFAAVSQATVAGTLPHYLRSRATVVYDGLDLEDYPIEETPLRGPARHILGLPEDKLLVGMVGRLSRQKGQQHFIEAARRIVLRYPDVCFVHAGGRPSSLSRDRYESELAEQSRDLCLQKKFIWLDYINAISLFWAAVDIAVVPSSGPEAFGRVVIEAMAMQRPVIVTACGGPEEIINSPDVGVNVPIADVETLAKEIQRLIDNPLLRERMGKAARKHVEENFSAQLYAERIMNLYDSILEKPN